MYYFSCECNACVVNVMLLLSHLSVSLEVLWDKSDKNYNTSKKSKGTQFHKTVSSPPKKLRCFFGMFAVSFWTIRLLLLLHGRCKCIILVVNVMLVL